MADIFSLSAISAAAAFAEPLFHTLFASHRRHIAIIFTPLMD